MSENQEWLFQETTNNVRISILPQFYAEGSNREQNLFIWVYSARIENLSNNIIQITGRHWSVFDEHGKVEELKAPGVAGQQPILRPSEAFDYISQVRLFTDSGLMQGEYFATDMVTGQQFSIQIPPFSLDSSNDKKDAS